MNRQVYEQAADIFARALELEGAERQTYLDEACQDNADMRSAVDRLLDADNGDSFLDAPYQDPTLGAEDELDFSGITSIGGYAVRRLIARGGMAAVFLAEQANPQRDVAIKLFSPSVCAGETLRNEAEALGRLRHPGIARVYEAGTATVKHAEDRPFRAAFVAMEYIEGETLDTSRPRSRGEIIELLVNIAEAIEHAHQRGVIHRDIKPSNIVVCEEGRPHIIDFGVGVLRDGPDRPFQSTPLHAGTLAYMAPEQLLGAPGEIDTRVDVYAIGLIGYEMIMGHKLHAAAKSVDGAALDRVLRPVRADEREIRRLGGHELCAVILRATDPDRAHRYSSAGELAAELRRVAEGKPVTGSESRPLRSLVLYARRNSGITSVVTIAGLLVVAAFIGMAMATARATNAAEVADNALAEARREAVHAERLAGFLKSSFLGLDPEERGPSITLFEAIDYAADRIGSDLGDTPEAEADVRFAIGFVYRRQGRLQAAMEQVSLSHALRAAEYGPRDERTLESREELGYLKWLYAGDAAASYETLSAVLQTHVDAGRAETSDAAWIRMKLAPALLFMDRIDEADAHLIAAEPLMITHYGAPYAARTTRQRAVVALHRGDVDQAVNLAQRAIALCEGVQEQEYIVARSVFTLGRAMRVAGRHEEAAAMLDDAHRRFSTLLTHESVELINLAEETARLHLVRGEYSEALALSRDVAKRRRSLLAAGHPDIAGADAITQLCLAGSATRDERDRLIDSARSIAVSAYGPGHLHTRFIEGVSIHGRD